MLCGCRMLAVLSPLLQDDDAGPAAVEACRRALYGRQRGVVAVRAVSR